MSHHLSVFILFCIALLPVNGSAQVLVNQSGYNSADSKRFTAPLAADGTPFSIISDPAGTPVFSGIVSSGLGDFSDFKPAETANFRVQIGTAPSQQTSYVFGIGPFWIERVSYRRVVQFFIDSRAGHGDATTWNVAGGKFSSAIAWRDSHQFSFELRTLIQWYAANPDAFGTDRMPIEGTYNGLRNSLPADAPGSHPWWNEPGNIAGFPASVLAAATRIFDPGKVKRLRARRHRREKFCQTQIVKTMNATPLIAEAFSGSQTTHFTHSLCC